MKNILEAGKRRLSKPICKKEPMTIELIQKVYESLIKEENAFNMRSICVILLAYAGFLRSQELLGIRRSDIIFDALYMSIFIEKSKTDIYRDGAWVIIARTNSKLCPVSNLLKLINLLGIEDENSDQYIFCDLSACRSGYRIRSDKKALSYSALRDLFQNTLKPHVCDINKYGLHSLRSGGATRAANFRITDRLFKRHGRWRSENAKDGYVKDALQSRLSVSQCLGL